MPNRPHQAADSSTPKGGSPQGEVPVLDKDAVQKLIREDELKEEKERQAAATESEGSTRYAYQQGDTVHGKVDATKAQQQEQRDSPQGEDQSLASLRDTVCTSSSRRSGSASSWNYLVEFQHKPKVYTNGYRSPYEKYEQRFPGGIAAMLNALAEAQQMEFSSGHSFMNSASDDRNLMVLARESQGPMRQTMPRNSGYTMLSSWKGRDVYREAQYIRDDFSLLTSVVAEAYGPDFFSYITRNSADHEMRKKYRIISAEGYPLYDRPFSVATEGQGKDFKSSFARKAKSDLIAYERLRAKREAELEELYTRPFEDIAVEEFLDQLPKPDLIAYERLRAKREAELEELYTRPFEDIAVEEFLDQLPKPQKRWILPARRGRMPMLRWIPLVSKQEQGTYLRALLESEIKDEHMDATEEANDENMAADDSSQDEEHMLPDISPEKDDGLHDQGSCGRVKTVVDPEAFKAATSAEEKNEEAFEKMENAKDDKGLEHTEEFKYFCEVIFFGEERGSPMRKLIEQKNGPTYGLACVKTDPHPMTKYTLSEDDLFKHMCTMDPIYERYPAKKDVVFRSGDVRSTLDDQLMEKASNVKEPWKFKKLFWRRLSHFQGAATQLPEKNS
eukprot:s2704_g7.t1